MDKKQNELLTKNSRNDSQNENDIVIDHQTIMGILCYLGPLVLVPYFTEREKPFIKYHLKQGLVLIGIWLALYLISSALFVLSYIPLLTQTIILLQFVAVILTGIGIVHVVKRQQKPLPLIGHLTLHIKI